MALLLRVLSSVQCITFTSNMATAAAAVDLEADTIDGTSASSASACAPPRNCSIVVKQEMMAAGRSNPNVPSAVADVDTPMPAAEAPATKASDAIAGADRVSDGGPPAAPGAQGQAATVSEPRIDAAGASCEPASGQPVQCVCCHKKGTSRRPFHTLFVRAPLFKHLCLSCYKLWEDRELCIICVKRQAPHARKDCQWVECAKCLFWVHASCAALGDHPNLGALEYECPTCAPDAPALSDTSTAHVAPAGPAGVGRSDLVEAPTDMIDGAGHMGIVDAPTAEDAGDRCPKGAARANTPQHAPQGKKKYKNMWVPNLTFN